MELNNDFRVSVPPPEAWKVLTDVERIAPLLPGAQLQEIEGDEYRGIVKVKVGPITAQYKGTATFVERDEVAGRMVLKASGRDTRGQGNASALITVVMAPDGDGTKVGVVTELTITGKVAQFGRGVLAEVSGKLITQFVDALEADISSGSPTAQVGESAADGPADGAVAEPAAPGGEAAPAQGAKRTTAGSKAATAADDGAPPADGQDQAADAPTQGGAKADAEAAADDEVKVTAPVEGADDAAPAAGADKATPAPEADKATPAPEADAPAASDGGQPAAAAPTTGPRRIESPEPEPVDLLDAAGGSVAKRLVPVAGVAVALLAVLILRRRRHRRRAQHGLRRLRASLPELHVSLPELPDLRASLPDLPDFAAAEELGRRAAKRARKAARRR
jgi:uncharacterized protein